MLIFNEGLPRSGKSFEAMSRHVAKALRDKRGVTAYIEGISHEKIAPLVGLELEECRQLLQVLTREQACEFWTVARKNDLIVLDEVANYWHNKAKLPEAAAAAFKEHGHHGQDILLMDQDLRDVHAIIRRRVEMKFCFVKLSALGAESRYSVTTYRHKGGDEFERLGTQIHKYDQAWYGTYSSHVDADVQTANYQDKRGSALATPIVRFGMPAALVLLLFGAWRTWTFFHQAPTVAPVAKSAPAPSSAPSVAARPVEAAAKPPEAKVPRSVQETYLTELNAKYRPRLAGVLVMRGRADGVVEWMDGGSRVADRLTFEQLRQLGAAIVLSQGIARFVLGDLQFMATMWPVEPVAGSSEATLAAMRDQAGKVPVADVHGPQMIIMGTPQVRDSRGAEMTIGKKAI